MPATYLVQINGCPDATMGGRTPAADLFTGGRGSVWLPMSYPIGTVVCFTDGPHRALVRAWMTRAMWAATAREAARTERDALRDRRLVQHAEKRRLQAAADQVVAEAERIVRDSIPR